MSDFVAQIGTHIDPHIIKLYLENRPGLRDRSAAVLTFSWGTLVVQAPLSSCYAPFDDNGLVYACVGRPNLLNFRMPPSKTSAFTKEIASRWACDAESTLFEQLSGTHAIIRCSAGGIAIMTDRMGAYPVYKAVRKDGSIIAISTSVELLAKAANSVQDWDLVSLAELLVFNNITFPFSSREGIEELQPASISKIDANEDRCEIDTKIFWEPKEPPEWLPDNIAVNEVENALRLAGTEATRGCSNVAVSLSGGLDSRAVLLSIPAEVERIALTYRTHENNETMVARKVAQAVGVKHIFADRSEDYFAELLLDRGIALLGAERRGAVHGFCIFDSALQSDFDLILGGQLSDTLLKDHYMPFWQREEMRPLGIKERVRKHLPLRKYSSEPSVNSTIGRAAALIHLDAELRKAVEERRSARLQQVLEIRPETGEEWSRFWPVSRQDDLAHVLGNIRLFSFDTLFMQQPIVNVAALLSPRQRYSGAVANQAFAKCYGTVGAIENANTGYPANAVGKKSWYRRRRKVVRHFSRIQGAAPWNDVQTSWADNDALQRFHPQWTAARDGLMASPATRILDHLTAEPISNLMEKYSDKVPPTFNQMLVQIGICINRAVAGDDA